MSQPTGTFSGIREFCRLSGSPRDIALLVSEAIGNRSPLKVRSTVTAGVLLSPAPAVGLALKSGSRLTKNKASAVTPSAPAKRTRNDLIIGLLRSARRSIGPINQTREKPPPDA